MVTITLKAQHLFFIASLLKGIVAGEYFRLLNAIKSKLDQEYAGDDTKLISVDATSREAISIFSILASLPEGQVTLINEEMNLLLMPQIMSGIMGVPTWSATLSGSIEVTGSVSGSQVSYGEIGSEITSLRASNWGITLDRINLGKEFLGFNV